MPTSSIETIRHACGISIPPSGGACTKWQVVLVGHAGENDFCPLRDQLNFDLSFPHSGLTVSLRIDTQEVMKRSGIFSKITSLADLVSI